MILGPYESCRLTSGSSRPTEISTRNDLTGRGLKYISKKRDVRIRAIAQYLAASEYDIVCLQECWVYTDFELIKDTVDRTLPYARFFNSYVLPYYRSCRVKWVRG